MKKILLAVMLTALIATLTVFPGFAAENDTAAATETVTEAVTEAVTETDTDTETEVEPQDVDGAIVQEDYLTRMLEGAKNWLMENPETVGSVACSGIMLAAALVMSKTSKKERKNGEERERRIEEKTAILNNNTVELAETAKNVLSEGRMSIGKYVTEMIAGVKATGDRIAMELRANRKETRANSILLTELIKDARLAEKRKDEIIAMYERERGEEAEVDDGNDQA